MACETSPSPIFGGCSQSYGKKQEEEMMKQINDTGNRKHSAEKSVNALFQDKTSSSNSQIVHFGSIKKHRLQLSRNLRDSPGFLEFVPGPGTLRKLSRKSV